MASVSLKDGKMQSAFYMYMYMYMYMYVNVLLHAIMWKKFSKNAHAAWDKHHTGNIIYSADILKDNYLEIMFPWQSICWYMHISCMHLLFIS